MIDFQKEITFDECLHDGIRHDVAFYCIYRNSCSFTKHELSNHQIIDAYGKIP